jgi:hypothetical protein
LEEALAVERQLAATDRMLFALRRRGPARSREEEARLDAVMRDPLLADGTTPASREARVQYHFARATYHFARGDWISCDGEMDRVLEEMEADPERLRWRLEEYLVRCNSSFMIWRRTGRHDRTVRQLERLEAMDFRDQPHRDALEAHRFRICLANRLYLYEDTGRHRDAVALVPALLEGLERHGPFLTVTNRIGLYLQLAVHEQRLGHLDEAIGWTNRYLEEEAGCMRADKHGHVRLFKIILHYEAGHRDLLPHLIIAAWRHFRRMERLFALERLILHALRYRFLRARSPAEERRAMAGTLAELDALLADPRERVALEHFDFRDWLAGRLEGRYPVKTSPDG